MQRKTVFTQPGETLTIRNQWAAQAKKAGTTVSSSVWTYGGTGTLSGASLVTPLASVTLAVQSGGTLKNTVTLANGEVLIADRLVSVT